MYVCVCYVRAQVRVCVVSVCECVRSCVHVYACVCARECVYVCECMCVSLCVVSVCVCI